MAKRRSHSRKRSQKGGDLSGNPPSAWGWGLGTAGDGWRQFMYSLTLQPGQNANMNQSNDLVLKKGGRSRRSRSSRKSRSRSRRGGNLGLVLSQAAVPLSLLGVQQMYGKHTRRNKKH